MDGMRVVVDYVPTMGPIYTGEILQDSVRKAQEVDVKRKTNRATRTRTMAFK